MASRGVRIVEHGGARKSKWRLAAALLLAAGALVALWRWRADEPPVTAQAEPAVAAAPVAPSPPTQPTQRTRRARRKSPPPTPSPATEPAPELNFTLPTPGSEPTGIALFPPPGTDPPKRGLVVPEGFELPEGYVRHYQATDDGQELPAILMFHPDFDWLDENGDPIEIPEDRVVPPELAPAGLPLERLELPAPKT